jgi:hypothetical protein
MAGGPAVVSVADTDTVRLVVGAENEDGCTATLTRHQALALAYALVDAVDRLIDAQSGAPPG